MSKAIGIAVAVLVFLALVVWALAKKGWIVITKVADSKKYSVSYQGPKFKVSKKAEEAKADAAA